MKSPIRKLSIIRYYDNKPWDLEEINIPSWDDIEKSIRKMDNYYFPIIQLNLTENDEDDSIFNICGGHGKFAIFHMMGEWQYEDPNGGDGEVRLWDSDQGYYCREKNILTDIEKVLRITKIFFETGSYDGLNDVE